MFDPSRLLPSSRKDLVTKLFKQSVPKSATGLVTVRTGVAGALMVNVVGVAVAGAPVVVTPMDAVPVVEISLAVMDAVN